MTEATPEPDDLGWDVDRDGRMIDHAVDPGEEVLTDIYESVFDPDAELDITLEDD